MYKKKSFQRKLQRATNQRVRNSYKIFYGSSTNEQLNSLRSNPEVECDRLFTEERGEPKSHSTYIIGNDSQNTCNSKTNFDTTSEECLSEFDISKELHEWCVKNKITHSSATDLLKILKKHSCFSSLPSDARSLVKTPRKINIIDLEPGEYCHFGLQLQLSKLTPPKCELSAFNLQFSVDGLPIAKSTGKQFWPILCCVVELDLILEVGIYCGNEKPKASKDFLSAFVGELNDLCENGFKFNGKRIAIKIHSFICDAPARAFILNIKGHTGYFGCGKCTQEGEYIERRVTFPEVDCAPRTDKSFREKRDEDHHHSPSELEGLNINLVKQFPYEYMHLVCLGVVRKLVLLWFGGNINKFRLSCKEKLNLTRKLICLKPFIPSEFARKPRAIEEVKRWKATELRQFLLYSGPVVLKSTLPKKYYNHFICLHLAVRILCCKTLYKTLNSYAHSLLKTFVIKFSELYGAQHMSYNVHGLVHLAEDALTLGPLDSFSAFKFEDHLGYLQSLLKGKRFPLQQVHNRIVEKRNIVQYPSSLKTNNTQLILNSAHSELICEKFKIKLKLGDNICELKSGELIKITSFNVIDNKLMCRGNVLKVEESLFKVPADSNIVGVVLAELSRVTKEIPVSLIFRKCAALPFSGKFVIFPLLH